MIYNFLRLFIIYFCLIDSGEFDRVLLMILEILEKFPNPQKNMDSFTNKSRSSNSPKTYQRKIKQIDNLRKF